MNAGRHETLVSHFHLNIFMGGRPVDPWHTQAEWPYSTKEWGVTLRNKTKADIKKRNIRGDSQVQGAEEEVQWDENAILLHLQVGTGRCR